jgi:serine/threonine protein kinase
MKGIFARALNTDRDQTSAMNEFKPIQFGKYILLDKIASGGMAELYRGKITGVKGFEKLIAIKKILPHLTSEESLITSFIEEAKLAAFLQHPNIVQIYDFGNMEGTYFLAMEYLFGKDLKNVIKKSEQLNTPLRLEDSLHIIARVCKGLDYAHNMKDFHGKSLNIIHRDIGPQNIFITYDGQVKVIDFGIAKAANQTTSTQGDLIKGKVAYMSPEQAQGEQVDHRSDIFSIGILLYELVTRKRMFVGDNYQIYARVCKAEFEPPESTGVDLPPILYSILSKALAEKPAERYQSADEMATDLDKCISQLSFQPGSRSISEYMKTLFEHETHTEEHAIREAASFDHSELPDSQTDTESRDEETRVLKTGAFAEKPKRKRHLNAVLALLLILNGVLYTMIVLGGNPGEILSREKWIGLSRFFNRSGPENATLPGTIHNTQAETVDAKQTFSSQGSARAPSVLDSPELEAARNLVKDERFSEAIVLFENILSKDLSLTGSIAEPYSRALQGQAVKIVGDAPDKAKRLLQQSLELAPENPSTHYLLGRIYTKEKDYQQAVAAYEKAVELKTDIAGVYFNLGFIYYAVKKDYSRAQEMYTRTVELSPPFLDEALFNLALSQKRLGKRQESITNLESAVRVNPDNKQARELLERLTFKANKS